MSLGDDPIHADDAVGADDVVETEGLGLDLIAYLIGNAGRGDLVHFAFVLGVVVKELVVGYYLGNGESDCFLFGLINAAGHFRSLHERLADDLIALLERTFDSGVDVLNGLHFRAAEGRAADVRFDETGQTKRLGDLRCVRPFLTGTKHQTVGNMEAEIGEIVVAGIFVERQGSG